MLGARRSLCLAVIVVASACSAGSPGCHASQRAHTARVHLISVADQLAPCMTSAQVDAIIRDNVAHDIRSARLPTGGWLLDTPPEIGWRRWRLYLDMADERLVGIRFRTNLADWNRPRHSRPDVMVGPQGCAGAREKASR